MLSATVRLLDIRECGASIVTYPPHHSLTCHPQSCFQNREADSTCLLGWSVCGAPVQEETKGWTVYITAQLRYGIVIIISYMKHTNNRRHFFAI